MIEQKILPLFTGSAPFRMNHAQNQFFRLYFLKNPKQTRTSNMRGKRKQGDQVKGGFVSAVGVWMEVQGHVPRGGGTEAKETEEREGPW